MGKSLRILQSHLQNNRCIEIASRRGQEEKACWKRPKLRSYKNTEVDRIVKANKRVALLKNLPKCQLEGSDGKRTDLQHKLHLEYLGHMLQGDGGCNVDVDRRTAMARRTFNELYSLWGGKQLPLALKLRIFNSNVLTRVVWGSEGWLLTEAVIRKLNGW
jgi:hypothetical protein